MLPCIQATTDMGSVVRITGGECRGRVITAPEGLEVRPTSSKIRQAFFNIISNKIPDARFVDVCAGSGLMGLEALSRGAQSLIAIDQERRLLQAIEQNCEKFGFKAQLEVICGDARRVLAHLHKHEADVIFADPPYKSQIAETILQEVAKSELLALDGLIAVEHAQSLPPPETVENLTRYDSRKYGHTVISFYRRSSVGAACPADH